MADEYAGFREEERRKRIETLMEAASYMGGKNYDLYKELLKDDPDRWIGH